MLGTKEVYGFHSVAKMGDYDAAAHHECHVEGVGNFFVGIARLDALDEVVVNAVVAAEDHGGDEAKELFGTAWKGSIVVGDGVEIEEPVDAEVTGGEDSLVHALAVGAEIFKPMVRTCAVGFAAHGASGVGNIAVSTMINGSDWGRQLLGQDEWVGNLA